MVCATHRDGRPRALAWRWLVKRALLFALALSACGPNVEQIMAMGTWSAAARAACAVPTACPAERACFVGVKNATRPGAVNKTTYKAAATACRAYGAP